MPGRECYHCKQWIDEGEAHDCWTTTEAALTEDLSDDLRDAWERLRETAVEFGDQRIYASHHSIIFARNVCYFFVRPKPKFLELCIFLGRPVNAPQVKSIRPSSKTKFVHVVRVTHRDEVEAPITDWLREAYALPDKPATTRTSTARRQAPKRPASGTVETTAAARTRTTRRATARRKPSRRVTR
jgi:hypothetical protein